MIDQLAKKHFTKRALHVHNGTMRRMLWWTAVLLAFVLNSSASEQLPLIAPIFGNNMVIQRGITNTIWGWVTPGTTVEVVLLGHAYGSVADTNGLWKVRFRPPDVAEPFNVKVIIGGTNAFMFTNVVVGDVWVCGGQSNMEFPLRLARNGEEEVKNANYPEIRFFKVRNQPAYEPRSIVQGSWRVCSPASVVEDGGLSAVAYFFARKILTATNVPIGLIQVAVGGTPVETWMSEEAVRETKEFEIALQELVRLRSKQVPEYGNYVMHWYDEYDIGQRHPAWHLLDFDDSDWKSVNITNAFSVLGVSDTPALCYFRKKVVLPEPLPGKPAVIMLGVIERMDTTWVNGEWVGASAWVENPRRYIIRPSILKPGTNLIVVRVLKTRPDGGFKSDSSSLKLVLGDGTEISLAGEWKAKVAVDARPPHPLPYSYENWPVIPTVLYNGMIAPLRGLSVAGFIWYQGEANVGRAKQYRKLMETLIYDWRRTFNGDQLPFYMVSLAAFLPRRDNPGDDAWAELREAQAQVAYSVTNCGLAVAIDVGDANDIHPRDKKEVGERLALWALAGYYKLPVVASGPLYASSERTNGAIRIRFHNTAGGLIVRGSDKPAEFWIAGADKKWHRAEAKVEGETVLVWSSAVPEPVAVRYAWQANPEANLYNKAGLPAVPFRTDDW